MKRRIIMTAALAVGACVGTETDNPVHDFASSDCKSAEQIFTATEGRTSKGIGDPSGPAMRTNLMQTHAAELAGLRCVAWEHGPGGEVTIDATNFQGACQASYEPELVRAEDGAYEFQLVTEDAAGCGACTYDWTFSFTPKTTDAEEVHVRVVTGYAFENDVGWTTEFEAVIERDDKVSCVEAQLRVGLQTAGCAEAFTPCAEHDGRTPGELAEVCGVAVEENGCQADLECVPGVGCRTPCETAADCGNSGALLCDQGVCRAAPALWVE